MMSVGIALSPDQIGVTVAGVVLIVFVLWYFLGESSSSRGPSGGSSQEVVITVQGGYVPETVVLERGKPAKLRFQREEDAECSAEVVLPAFGIRRTLPPFKTTTIDIEPDETGEFEYHCGKGMMRGRIVVVD
jgi:plastocyanin domain-containing protein